MKNWHGILIMIIAVTLLVLFAYIKGELNKKEREDPNYYVGRHIDVNGQDCVIEHQRVGTIPIRRTKLVAVCNK